MTKERPILMSGGMVRAILEGRKTQTRRIMKVQSPNDRCKLALLVSTTGYKRNIGKLEWVDGIKSVSKYFSCPYGVVGDHLWVRETFFEVYGDDFAQTGEFVYRAKHEGYVNVMDEEGGIKVNKDGGDASPWKPSIHMPRWASRILLEITSIRVERLQDISEEDAIAELYEIYHDGWELRTGDGMDESHYMNIEVLNMDTNKVSSFEIIWNLEVGFSAVRKKEEENE